MKRVLLLWCMAITGLTACAQTSAVVDSLDGDYVYVCNQGEATVSVIDAATLEVVDTVDLKTMGFDANAKPHHVVVDRDGSHWYVSLIGANTVLKMDRDNQIVGRAAFQVPGMMAMDPIGTQLYVGRSMSAVNPPQSIGVIDRGDMSVDEIEVFFPRPHALAVSPDGRYVFSASLAENRMLAIDMQTGDGTFTAMDGPINTLVQFAMAPSGRMVVGGQMTGKLFVMDTSEAPAIRVVAAMDVGAQPWHPVFGADGRHAYFGNKEGNTITVVDAETATVTKVLTGPGIAQPHGSALSPDGRYVFISNNNAQGVHDMGGGQMHMANGMVTVVDTQTNEIVKVIDVGAMPTGVGARNPR